MTTILESIQKLSITAKKYATQTAKKNPTVYGLMRKSYTMVNHVLPPRTVPGIKGRVHRNDLMLADTSPESAAIYQQQGDRITEFLGDALQKSGGRTLADVTSCLDFGCGHGRVLRSLAQRMPKATITACDLDPEAAAFCASEFGATPMVSSLHIRQVPLTSYEITWMGSVLTHLDEAAADEILTTLFEHLTDGGLLAFSAHGLKVIEHLEHHGPAVAAVQPRLQAELASKGFAYMPYSHYGTDNYGLAWHMPDYVPAMMDRISNSSMELVVHDPHGWLGVHDLWCFAKVAR